MRRLTKVEPWVIELVESEIGGPPVEIGKRYMHPEDGLIEITSGQYWGQHGLSNFWYWNVLDKDGKAIRGNHGYAGDWPEVKKGDSEPSITCPQCGRTSYNPNDIREGYCGFCHQYTGRKHD